LNFLGGTLDGLATGPIVPYLDHIVKGVPSDVLDCIQGKRSDVEEVAVRSFEIFESKIRPVQNVVLVERFVTGDLPDSTRLPTQVKYGVRGGQELDDGSAERHVVDQVYRKLEERGLDENL
jgi:hypothetical protein